MICIVLLAIVVKAAALSSCSFALLPVHCLVIIINEINHLGHTVLTQW